VILIDLGLAKTFKAKSENSRLIGNNLYWSPEATAKDKNDGFAFPNSDIFAAASIFITCFYKVSQSIKNSGKTLYEALTLSDLIKNNFSPKDPSQKVFQDVLPLMIQEKPADWICACRLYKYITN